MTFHRMLREPMLHFLVIGLGLFVAWDKQGRPAGDESRIVISQAVVDDLVRQHQATWNRPPSEAELTGLVDHYILDEVLYREGMALGLDRDDRMIKRRVRQKVELIVEEESTPAAPTDAELTDYVSRNPAKFVRPAVVDLEQVFEGATLLPRQLAGVPLDMVARDFGEGFARAVETAPIGKWVTAESPYGSHRVRVSAREPGSLPPTDTIRAAVAREWEHERRQRTLAERYRGMREGYQVTIDATWPLTRAAK